MGGAMSKDNGGPAFPITEQHGANTGCAGMTLRDHFAGLAMQALTVETGNIDMIRSVARIAYDYADAMIEARKQ